MPLDIISSLRKELQQLSNPEVQASSRNFFREEINAYGIKTATVIKIGKDYYKEYIQHLPKQEVFTLCEVLWRSGYMEESFIACHWSYAIHKQYEPADFAIFEKWVQTYVSNWASCDTFCNHTIGTFLEMYPKYVTILKKWATSKNRWVRRASAVSLIIPAKQGKFLNDIFDIAGILLLDPDDLVQKGYGWMLKAASQAHQKEVFDYVMKQKSIMPRTALRYAIEKMPESFRKKAMEK